METAPRKRPGIRNAIKAVTGILTLGAMIYAFRSKRSHGTFLKVPFDFRLPTWQRIKKQFWDPEDERIFTPRVFGVGWAINVHQVWKRLNGTRRQPSLEAAEDMPEPDAW